MASLRWVCLQSLMVVTLGLGGCASWKAYDLAPNADHTLPYRLRATRQDSTRIALTSPFIRGDTLYGRVQRDTVAVPMKEIAGLERERIDAGRTIGVVVGVPAVALGITYLILCTGGDGCQATY